LDPGHVQAITSHYTRKYPALHWDWLLQELSALRVVSCNPRNATAALVHQHQLGSALPLIERFGFDLGLVVVEPSKQEAGERIVSFEADQLSDAATPSAPTTIKGIATSRKFKFWNLKAF